MLTMLFLVNVVPLLYSFYGSREVSPEAARMAH
jgi:hypothetical protein